MLRLFHCFRCRSLWHPHAKTPDQAVDYQPNPAISRLSPKPLDACNQVQLGNDTGVVADALHINIYRPVRDGGHLAAP
jgi:hypothetical protein